MANDTRLVWDIPLRTFHWVLALSILGSYITAEGDISLMPLHLWLGYLTLALLIFRVIWGFIGPRHARFASFILWPPQIWSYMRALVTNKSVPSVGHNPLGGISVIALLGFVAAQAITGLFTADDVEFPIYSGPYLGAVSTSTARAISRFHRQNFNWIIALVALHLLAIAFYWLVKKQNLVGPMVTGRKPAAIVPEHEAIASSQLIKAVIVALLSVAAVYLLVTSAPPPPAGDFDF